MGNCFYRCGRKKRLKIRRERRLAAERAERERLAAQEPEGGNAGAVQPPQSDAGADANPNAIELVESVDIRTVASPNPDATDPAELDPKRRRKALAKAKAEEKKAAKAAAKAEKAAKEREKKAAKAAKKQEKLDAKRNLAGIPKTVVAACAEAEISVAVLIPDAVVEDETSAEKEASLPLLLRRHRQRGILIQSDNRKPKQRPVTIVEPCKSGVFPLKRLRSRSTPATEAKTTRNKIKDLVEAAGRHTVRQPTTWSLGSITGRSASWSFKKLNHNRINRQADLARRSVRSWGHRSNRSTTLWPRPITTATFIKEFKDLDRKKEFQLDAFVANGAFGDVYKVSYKVISPLLSPEDPNGPSTSKAAARRLAKGAKAQADLDGPSTSKAAAKAAKLARSFVRAATRAAKRAAGTTKSKAETQAAASNAVSSLADIKKTLIPAEVFKSLVASAIASISDEATEAAEAQAAGARKFWALKVLEKSKILLQNGAKQVKDEAIIQLQCRGHPFIVQQLDSWQNRRSLFILLEYMPNGELFTKIQKFSVDLARLYVAEIAVALDFLHNAGFIYRDAKPANILLTQNFHLKLTDFGLSKNLKIGQTTTTLCGTFDYMAPEIWRGEPYGHAVDWWALGVIACQMFTRQAPDFRVYLANWPSDLPPAVQERLQYNLDRAASGSQSPQTVTKILPKKVESLCHEAKDLINRLLEIDTTKRIHSVLGLQKIAMYMNFRIHYRQLLEISALDIIKRDEIPIKQEEEVKVSRIVMNKIFQEF